jgi:hypothetical protein
MSRIARQILADLDYAFSHTATHERMDAVNRLKADVPTLVAMAGGTATRSVESIGEEVARLRAGLQCIADHHEGERIRAEGRGDLEGASVHEDRRNAAMFHLLEPKP